MSYFETSMSHECAFRALESHIRTWLKEQYGEKLGKQEVPFWIHRNVETDTGRGIPGFHIRVRGIFSAWCSEQPTSFYCNLEVFVTKFRMELVARDLTGEIKPA